MTQPAERREFQAEVKQLLDLVIHSLYTNKDVFLRELISNASDALDRRRFEQLTRPELASEGELLIRIDADREQRTLAISDNGIGMTRDEVIQNIGTIAKSGTKEFLAAVTAGESKKLPPDLIGQFGVGFYSAFMVADKVTVLTRRAGESTGTLWESAADGAYSLTEAERPEPGTTVILHLKPEDSGHGVKDYANRAVLREIVKAYSDFVTYPIRTKRQSVDGSASSALEYETLNSMKAIWERPKAEVAEADYKDFYRHLTHDWADPLATIPIRMEGTTEAYALLYVPPRAAFDIYRAQHKSGVQLYVRRVFVMTECKDILPSHLRFITGVVDAPALSLNVSREMLQRDRQIPVIRKQLVKKIYAALDELKREKQDDYVKFWEALGPVLKEGIYETQETDRLLELLLARSTAADSWTSLEEYTRRMPHGQDQIYFLSGPSHDAVANSPLLEAFVAKRYEVLLFSDPVDQFWLDRAPRYKEWPLVSIAHGEVKLGTDEERKKESDELEQRSREHGDLFACLRDHLAEDVKDVRLSTRLTSSPVCLVADPEDPTPMKQRMLEQLGQATKYRRILEINPALPILPKLQALYDNDTGDARLKLYADLLLGQAYLAESSQVPNPAAFSKVISEMMLRAL